MTDTTTLRVSPADATLVTVYVDNTVVAEPGPGRTTVILTAPIGPRGPQGDTGDIGPTGLSAYEVAVMDGFVGTEEQWLESLVGADGASGGSYTHVQGVTSSVWTVVHNLGYFPNVHAVDTLDRQIVGDVQHIDVTTLTITYLAAPSGKAHCS